MRRGRTLFFLIIVWAGCYTWTPQDPAVAPAEAQYDRVRVHLAGGTTLVLHRVRMRPDSVFGYTSPSGATETARGFPMTRVEEYELRSLDGDRTASAAAIGAGVLGALVCLAACGFPVN